MIKVTKPGRLQSGVATVATPTTSTGANYTINTRTRPLAARSVNANTLPLTVQTQTFTHPLKPQRF